MTSIIRITIPTVTALPPPPQAHVQKDADDHEDERPSPLQIQATEVRDLLKRCGPAISKSEMWTQRVEKMLRIAGEMSEEFAKKEFSNMKSAIKVREALAYCSGGARPPSSFSGEVCCVILHCDTDPLSHAYKHIHTRESSTGPAFACIGW